MSGPASALGAFGVSPFDDAVSPVTAVSVDGESFALTPRAAARVGDGRLVDESTRGWLVESGRITAV